MELAGAVCTRRKCGTIILNDIDDKGNGPLKVLLF